VNSSVLKNCSRYRPSSDIANPLSHGDMGDNRRLLRVFTRELLVWPLAKPRFSMDLASSSHEGEEPFFSVVTPVFNGADYVHGYVRTLLDQTFSDWEAIVVDDASTDSTAFLLEEAVADDPRFRVIRSFLAKKISCPYHARNVGIEHARGQFVCFLDIDDRWLSWKLAAQAIALSENEGLELLFSAYYRAHMGVLRGASVRMPPSVGLVKVWAKIANPIPMLTACVRKKRLAGIRFRPVYHEDYVFWREVIDGLRPCEMYCATTPCAVYYVNPASLSGNKVKSALWIWSSYRAYGYSRLNALFAMCVRSVLQLLIVASDLVLKFRAIPWLQLPQR
jgi:teichuronic acid biosynthesis glycosyltransferase TuaG